MSQTPMQARLWVTVPGSISQQPDPVTDLNPLAPAHHREHWLIGRAQTAVRDGHDRFVGDVSGEGDLTRTGGEHGPAGVTTEVDAAVTGPPVLFWRIELAHDVRAFSCGRQRAAPWAMVRGVALEVGSHPGRRCGGHGGRGRSRSAGLQEYRWHGQGKHSHAAEHDGCAVLTVAERHAVTVVAGGSLGPDAPAICG